MVTNGGCFPGKVVLFFVLVQLTASCSGINSPRDESETSNSNGTNLANQVIDTVRDCKLKYTQLPETFTRLSLYHLELRPQRDGEGSVNNQSTTRRTPLKKIDFNIDCEDGRQLQLQLEKLNLNSQLPFVFFTNGFNHDGVIDGTWMEDVAKVYLSRYLGAGGDSSSSSDKNNKRPGMNIIFLDWYVEGLLAHNALSVIPVYYKTMANFDIIVGRFQAAIQQIIEHLETLRARASQNTTQGLLPQVESRKDYYGKFRFFGHSLGSHILAQALDRVHKSSQDRIKFGQLYGLDPAVPCFLNEHQGLTASRASGVAREVIVLHSNAGILGAFSPRGQLEIVLNGGTFQPNCSMFDLKCHHVRSTDIFRYTDDRCKMVAYRCDKYEQFKVGACETCDTPTEGRNLTSNCVLVNLNEQNEDSESIRSIIMESDGQQQQVRQLADNDDGNDVYDFKKAISIGLALAREELDHLRKNAKSEYHFVNTNPRFGQQISKSHCLQHYQLRLLTLVDSQLNRQLFTNQSAKTPRDCPLRLLYGNDRINVKLFQEPPHSSNITGQRRNTRDQMSEFELTTIIEDELHTGLATFVGGPELFVGALIDNIDLSSWSECLADQGRVDDKQLPVREFFLDIAFMSHTRKSVRHAFSSVLCAKWPTDDHTRKAEPNQLVLSLCRQSELANVSNKIDHLIGQIKFHNQYEPWHVVLLNSLFSLFSGWEPL